MDSGCTHANVQNLRHDAVHVQRASVNLARGAGHTCSSGANSSLASTADHNEFLCSKLRSKMNAVRPNILLFAASEILQQLDPIATFNEYVQQATQIAHRVQASSPMCAANPTAPKQTPPPMRSKGADKSEHKTNQKTRFQEMADLSDDKMLKEGSRCAKCGWLLERGGVHARGRTCDPDGLAMRVFGVRKDLQDNKNPKRKVRFNGPKDSSKWNDSIVSSPTLQFPCLNTAKFVHSNKIRNIGVHCSANGCTSVDEAVAGVTNLLLCLQTSDVVSEIKNRYQTFKAVMPDRNDAYVICPHTANAPWLPQLKGMVHLNCLILSGVCTSPIDPAHDIKYQVLSAPCRAQAGQLSQDKLPRPKQTLCNHNSPRSQSTFVFEGKLAGL